MTSSRLLWLFALTACRLDPLTDGAPATSIHVLPPGTEIPSIASDAELANQVAQSDGLDDKALAMAGNVVLRGTGHSAGAAVRYWSFGSTNRAPAPLYQFGRETAAGFEPLDPRDHPPLVDSIPGDGPYNALHGVYQVVVTDAYAGELITTTAALADAIEIGLVLEPVPTATFINCPLVLPGTTLEIGDGAAPAIAEPVYARGHVAAMFRFGGELGVQPATSLIPASQVSLLREAMAASHDATRPIFQATIPVEPPAMRANYTPASVVIQVDLAPGVTAAAITRDDELFTRNAMGAITGYTALVTRFEITTRTVNLQLQFADGAP
jgi:hypothetical protein